MGRRRGKGGAVPRGSRHVARRSSRFRGARTQHTRARHACTFRPPLGHTTTSGHDRRGVSQYPAAARSSVRREGRGGQGCGSPRFHPGRAADLRGRRSHSRGARIVCPLPERTYRSGAGQRARGLREGRRRAVGGRIPLHQRGSNLITRGRAGRRLHRRGWLQVHADGRRKRLVEVPSGLPAPTGPHGLVQRVLYLGRPPRQRVGERAGRAAFYTATGPPASPARRTIPPVTIEPPRFRIFSRSRTSPRTACAPAASTRSDFS